MSAHGIFGHPEFHGHERVVHAYDGRSGLRALVAVHRSRGAMAVGGVRMRAYASEAHALGDVLRLSRAMTYKHVLAGLPFGGGKSVILGDPAREKTPELLRAFGRLVESLSGAYMCGPDVGTSSLDMDVVSGETGWVGGTTAQMGRESSGPPTARGVFQGVRALARHLFGAPDLSGMHVAVQGAGAVGGRLAELLTSAGARVSLADVDAGVALAVAERTGASVVSPDEVLFLEADVLAPCALGGVLSAETIPRLRVRGVCGGANNQLATEEDGRRLQQRGVVVVPDFVASAGGVIAGTAASGHFPRARMESTLDGIYERALEILERAAAEGATPHEVAYRMAEERLAVEEAARAGGPRA